MLAVSIDVTMRKIAEEELVQWNNLLDSAETQKDRGETVRLVQFIREATVKMDEMIKDLNKVLTSRTALNTKKEAVAINTAAE